jgi:hypothetical protein
MKRLPFVAALALVAACKSKKPDDTATVASGSGSAVGSGSGAVANVGAGSGSGSGVTAGPGSGSGSSVAAVPVDDGIPPAKRLRSLLEKQVELVKAGDNAGLRAMFAPDAVVLIPEPAGDVATIDFANRLAAVANPKDLAIASVVGGNAPGAIWLTADLTYTANTKPMTTRVVELLDGANGWKIATASIAAVKPPTDPPTTPNPPPMPSPTDAGPLAKQLGAPSDLGAALAGADGEPGAGPEAFIVGWEHVPDNGGYVNGVMLATKLGKLGVTADPKMKPHERKTAAWSYAVEDLVVGTGAQAPRATGLAIAIPDAKDATKWVTVAASFNAL